MRRKIFNLAMAALLAIPIIPAMPVSQAQAQCYEGDWGGSVNGCGGFSNGGNRNWGNGHQNWDRPRHHGYDRPRHNGYDRPRWREERPRWHNDRPRYREDYRRPRWQHYQRTENEDNGIDAAALGLVTFGAGLIVGNLLSQPAAGYQTPPDFDPQGRVYDESNLTCTWTSFSNRNVQFLESGQLWNVASGSFCMPSPGSQTALYRLQNGRTTEVQFLN